MRENIHPNYDETTISCACGKVYHTRSTRKDLQHRHLRRLPPVFHW